MISLELGLELFDFVRFDTIVCVLISYSRKAANLLSNDNFGASEDFEYDGPLLLTDFTSSNPLPL